MQQILKEFSNPVLSKKMMDEVIRLAKQYKEKTGVRPAFMEVCGSHTMAFAKTGIKKMLNEHVKLISGPGCPVCVTDQKSIDAMIELTEGEKRIICTFGDMMRVPGTTNTLMGAKTEGKDIRVVYSPLDAVHIAEEHPDKEVIFLGIGFETTIPVLGATLKQADEKGVTNFSMWTTTKLVEPALRTLLEAGEVRMDGFLLPGHVSIVIGKRSYQFLKNEYKVPGVISGFKSMELLGGIYKLLTMLLTEKIEIINDYKRVVTDDGNKAAFHIMETYFEPCHESWRGIGVIENSGVDIKSEFAHLNAKKKFQVKEQQPRKTKCRCGDIIRGLISPEECALFGKACHPLNPIGPCMVSSEGSCAAYYQYMREAE